jgi:hypothetical protein
LSLPAGWNTVIVALVNLTFVTVGVHLEFGQAFWGATGSAVVTVKLALPFSTAMSCSPRVHPLLLFGVLLLRLL